LGSAPQVVAFPFSGFIVEVQVSTWAPKLKFGLLGVGIFFQVQDVQQLDEPITLEILKEQSFHPPQGFRYCQASEAVWFKEIAIMLNE
jgi:hypothetical protein